MNEITLKAARVNADMLQTEVAAKLGISAKTIGNWETGKTHPTGSHLMRLCEIYHVPVDRIILPK